MNNKILGLLSVLALIGAVALGQSSLKDTKTQLAAASDVIPVGTVMPYVGSSAPTGWLLAQGQCVAQATYPALYALTQSLSYQTGCAGGQFRLPPLNGRYLRGAGAPTDGQGGDTIALGTFGVNKTKANGLGTSIPSTAHTHGMNHMHQFAATNASGHTVAYNSGGYSYIPSASSTYFNAPTPPSSPDILYSSDSKYGGHTYVGATPDRVHTSARFYTTGPLSTQTDTAPNTGSPSAVLSANSGDTETSPHSYAVNYIIKY